MHLEKRKRLTQKLLAFIISYTLVESFEMQLALRFKTSSWWWRTLNAIDPNFDGWKYAWRKEPSGWNISNRKYALWLSASSVGNVCSLTTFKVNAFDWRFLLLERKAKRAREKKKIVWISQSRWKHFIPFVWQGLCINKRFDYFETSTCELRKELQAFTWCVFFARSIREGERAKKTRKT